MSALLTFLIGNPLAQLRRLGGPLLPCLIALNSGPSSSPVVTSVTLDSTTPTVGDTITATAAGTDCDTFTYIWKADGSAISGEIGQTYTATRADAMGHALTCTATGHGAGGNSTPLASTATSLVTGAPVNTVAPVVTTDGANAPGGPATAGVDTLSTTDGTWTGYPAPTIATYRWLADAGVYDPSAALATYATGGGDYFHNPWFCRVTATNDAGSTTVSADSNTINVISP